MTRTLNIVSLIAAAALAGCSNENHNLVSNGPDEGSSTNAMANANVQLPPSIAASKTYRCADNKLVYVDWLSDNKSANIRTEQGGMPTLVTAAEPGKPMTGAAGYSLSGAPTAGSATIAVPGHSAQSCKA
jgi:crotonobetainyl-CoA:carnitine CoA-transferase CaiB-like acyl-CoA transferase